MTTINDVEMILKKYDFNETAARWLKNPVAVKHILDGHISWNDDHAKFNHPEMVYPLDTNVVYYINHPESIDQYLD